MSGRKRKSGFWVTGKVLFFYFRVGDMAVFSLQNSLNCAFIICPLHMHVILQRKVKIKGI